MKVCRFRFTAILLIASLTAILIVPSNSVPVGDSGGPPSIVYTQQTWHHDCSNTTDFELNSTWETEWYPNWEFVEAPLVSDGERILLFGGPLTGSEQLWFGPIYLLKLPLNFSLATLISLTVDFEISNLGAASEECLCYLHLVDSMLNPVLSLFWFDDFLQSNAMRYGAKYWTPIFTDYGVPTNPVWNTTGRYEAVITNDDDEGLRFTIPTGTDQKLYTPSEDELLRNITYVVLMYGDHNQGFSVQTYLHDITLEFNYPFTGRTPEAIIDSTNTPAPTSLLQSDDSSPLFVWVVSICSAAMVIVFSSRILHQRRDGD
ncbi:MAG: hypothetical protein RTS72_06290 [Candidatus Thorarchaeota archaeon]